MPVAESRSKSKSKPKSKSKSKPEPKPKPAPSPLAATPVKADPAIDATPTPATPTSATPTPATPTPATKAGHAVADILAASAAVDYHLVLLGSAGPMTYTEDTRDIEVSPPTWFALVPVRPTRRRYVYVLQKEVGTDRIVVIHLIDGSGAVRVPPANGWLRAVVVGMLHLVESDLFLSRCDFVAVIGGHEPPPGYARPPFT